MGDILSNKFFLFACVSIATLPHEIPNEHIDIALLFEKCIFLPIIVQVRTQCDFFLTNHVVMVYAHRFLYVYVRAADLFFFHFIFVSQTTHGSVYYYAFIWRISMCRNTSVHLCFCLWT